MIRLTNALPMTVIALHYVCAGSEVLPPEYMYSPIQQNLADRIIPKH